MVKNPNPSKFSSNLDASVFYLPSMFKAALWDRKALLGQIPEFFLLLFGWRSFIPSILPHGLPHGGCGQYAKSD
jgi:hypothetical protein